MAIAMQQCKGWHPSGRFTLRVTADGLAPALLSNVAVEVGETTDVGDVRLSAGAEVAVRVVDRATRAPVPGAAIDVSPPGAGSDLQRREPGRRPIALADAGGRAAMRGLLAGNYTVSAAHDRYADASAEIRVEPYGRPLPELVLELTEGGAIEGVVRDSRGEPCSRALVSASRGIVTDLRWTKFTDDSGCYRLEHLSPGTYELRGGACRSDRESPAPPGKQEVKVVDGQTARVDFPQRAPGSITVHGAIHDAGAPMTGNLSLRPAADPNAASVSARVGEDGHYSVVVPAAGRYEANFFIGGIRSGNVVQFGVVVPDVVPDDGLDIELPNGRIAGRTVDASTLAPIGGIRVRVSTRPDEERARPGRMAQTKSREDGTFELRGLTGGTWQPLAWGKGYERALPDPVVFRDGSVVDDLRIALTPGVPFTVRAGEVDDAPISGAIVLHLSEPEAAVLGRVGVTGADGVATVKELGPGTHDLAVCAIGRACARLPAVVVQAGAPPAERAVELSAGAEIEVVAKDRDGNPVEGLRVFILGNGGEDISALVNVHRCPARPLRQGGGD